MFISEEHAQRSRLFRQVTIGMMSVATAVFVALIFVQPAQHVRAVVSLAAVNALGVLLLAVNRGGHTRAASIALVAGGIALVTVMSLSAGGIHNPSVTTLFIFVLTAGLLLGQRAGIVTAAVCSGIALMLALLNTTPIVTPPATPFSPLALWLLNTMYMGAVLILLRLATEAMGKALGRAESEISVRKRAELEREHLVHDLGERVKELRLLHAAARLLQETRPFDRSVLEELVAMMPAAWQHPESCEARIEYRDEAVATPGWCAATRRLAAPFATSAGRGVVEVIYRDEPRTVVSAFLKEERLLIESLAEMLAAYLEHDIAGRQRSQLETQLRQSQQMEALGTLAGGIAHDFNNLLTAIGGNTDLALTEPSLTAPVKEHLTELRRAHGRASDLVKRILLFSRRQESDRKPVAIAPVIDEAVALLRASLPAMIEIRVSVESDLPAVLADPSQIHQVIMNLGTNAAHAMGGRGGLLRITLDCVTIGDPLAAPSADLRAGPHVRISVGDTGTGMSPETRTRLFEPFFTTKGTAGTGLGLSVVHGIVTDHDGAITVESAIGQGSTFHVYLPAVEGGEACASTEEVALGHGEHVMYVDDEAGLVHVMTRLLKRLGYRSTGYSDAEEALRAFRANPQEFNAVITDMTMPRMTGAQLASELRALRPGMPVAIASGYESAEMEAAGRAGIARIAKPISMETLSQALRALLQQGA